MSTHSFWKRRRLWASSTSWMQKDRGCVYLVNLPLSYPTHTYFSVTNVSHTHTQFYSYAVKKKNMNSTWLRCVRKKCILPASRRHNCVCLATSRAACPSFHPVFTNESTSSKMRSAATNLNSTSRPFNGNDGSAFFIIKTARPWQRNRMLCG